MKKNGFTMAEVLIAIAIIGVIAALVLPVMLKNYNNRIFATKARRAYTAIVDACSHGLSDDQVKYPGDIRDSYCEYIPGKNCTVENGAGSITLKDGTVITLSGWGSQAGGDLDVTIDTNGTKKPDEPGKDIWTTKLTRDCKLADDGTYGKVSYLKAHDWRISDDTEDERLAKRRDFSKWKVEKITVGLSVSDCRAKQKSLGIEVCAWDPDYWAAAVEKCGGVQNLPTDDDLVALAKELYPTCDEPEDIATTSCTGTLDTSKLSKYPGLSAIGSSSIFLMSSYEGRTGYMRTRLFYNGASTKSASLRYESYPRVVCLGDLK